MIPVKEYELASGESEDELKHDVEKALSNGWQPQGGISCIVLQKYNNHNEPDGHCLRFYQAMVR